MGAGLGAGAGAGAGGRTTTTGGVGAFLGLTVALGVAGGVGVPGIARGEYVGVGRCE